MNYYLDIETTGLDPLHSKIITIQYMELDEDTAKPRGPLKILKEWESDEKTILKKFMEVFRPGNDWAFVPIGFNLNFEHKFFWQRCISNSLEPFDIFNRPFLDLHTIAVIMNKGSFKGSGLDKITNKPSSGKNIPKLYYEKNYTEIESYIKKEADEFSIFCSKLYEELPALLNKLRSSGL
jgi:hypothetical protein